MQRIIDNILYDTEVSDLLYTDVYARSRYYKTVNGRYFIVHINGEFEVTNEDAVKEILGKYDIQMYIQVFGEPEEG